MHMAGRGTDVLTRETERAQALEFIKDDEGNMQAAVRDVRCPLSGRPRRRTSPSGEPVISSQMLDKVNGNVTTTVSKSTPTRATPVR